jgi:hypothetical protein
LIFFKRFKKSRLPSGRPLQKNGGLGGRRSAASDQAFCFDAYKFFFDVLVRRVLVVS